MSRVATWLTGTPCGPTPARRGARMARRESGPIAEPSVVASSAPAATPVAVSSERRVRAAAGAGGAPDRRRRRRRERPTRHPPLRSDVRDQPAERDPRTGVVRVREVEREGVPVEDVHHARRELEQRSRRRAQRARCRSIRCVRSRNGGHANSRGNTTQSLTSSRGIATMPLKMWIALDDAVEGDRIGRPRLAPPGRARAAPRGTRCPSRSRSRSDTPSAIPSSAAVRSSCSPTGNAPGAKRPDAEALEAGEDGARGASRTLLHRRRVADEQARNGRSEAMERDRLGQ